jgi:hypothetical protein
VTATPRPTRRSVETLQPQIPPLRAPRRRGVVGIALEAAALGVVAFAALELATRLEDRIRFGTPVLSNFTDQADLIVNDQDGMHGRPNARFRKFVLNNYGFRGPDITERPPPGTHRLFAVGASETFGLGESPGREYPRQLEDSLAARDDLRRRLGVDRFEVVNGAMLGMSLPTLTQNVRARIARFGPSVVVAYPTPVQYLMDHRPVAAEPDSSVVTVPEPSFRLRVVPRLHEQVKLMLPGPVATRLRARDIEKSIRQHPAGWVLTAVPEDRVVAYDEDLRALVGEIRGIGAEPVLMAHVNVFSEAEPRDTKLLTAWRRFYPRASGDVLIAFDRRLRAVTCRVAADSGVALVDVEPFLASPRKQWFADYSHFNDRGAALVAGLVAQAVETRLLSSEPPRAGAACMTS